MNKYRTNLKKYLDDLAARKEAPGGGSAAALVAAAGVAALSMTANFTVGKEKYRGVEKEIKEILNISENLRLKFLKLLDRDVAGYKKVSLAYKMLKQTEKEKDKRNLAIQKALKASLSVPLQICRLTHEAAKLCPALAEKGNINLISDTGVGILFLETAFQAALLNVKINLKAIRDKEFNLEMRGILKPLEQEIILIKKQVLKSVNGKIEEA